jgi:large subunit ribosomal protein L31e
VSKEKKEKSKPSKKGAEKATEPKPVTEKTAPVTEKPQRRRRPAAKKVRRRKPSAVGEKPEAPKPEPAKPEEEKATLEEKLTEEKPEEVEEEKPEAEAPEEEIVEERLYTIPLRITNWVPRWKRTPRAVRFVREYITRHMKPDNVLIMPEVNEALWSRGLKKPPRRIRVRAVKNADGDVKIYLASA